MKCRWHSLAERAGFRITLLFFKKKKDYFDAVVLVTAAGGLRSVAGVL